MMLTWRTAAPSTWRRLSRVVRPTAEPVELRDQHYGFLPARFRHLGELHRVARIERIWEERGRGARADRRYFTVRCANMQRCTLFQDLRAGTWYVKW
jgi:hypothetical protein